MKRFRCIPKAIFLPILFFCVPFVSAILLMRSGGFDRETVIFYVFVPLCSILMGLAMLPQASRQIKIYPEYIVCTAAFPGSTFRMNYSECNVGMDYHCQNGNQIWWIYLCAGTLPQYSTQNPANRINSVRIKPGFIRVMYSEEVYDALLAVLPEEQKAALIAARHSAGFEKQGKIIF